MPGLDAYTLLLSRIEQKHTFDPALFINELRDKYSLNHVVYADLLQTAKGYRIHRLIFDENPAFRHVLETQPLTVFTPILRNIFEALTPILFDIDVKLDLTPDLLTVLKKSRLGPDSLVFPLLSPPGRRAFLSIQAEAGAIRNSYYRNLVRDLSSLAPAFHNRVISQEHQPYRRYADERKVVLTPREREVLGWAAAGKNYWEISVILDISERTVRHFMANVRQKLDAVSNKQAVANAVWLGLITDNHI